MFKMAAAAAPLYFRFRIAWRRCLENVKVHEPTAFCRDNAIHGCDITTSVLEKQTSVILLFHFRIRFQPHNRFRHYIMRQWPNFIQIGPSSAEAELWYWYHIDFQLQDRGCCAQFYFRFHIGWRRCLQKVNVYQTKFRRDNSIHC